MTDYGHTSNDIEIVDRRDLNNALVGVNSMIVALYSVLEARGLITHKEFEAHRLKALAEIEQEYARREEAFSKE